MSHVSGLNTNTIVVGVDVHKYSHTAFAIDCFGQALGIHEFSNDYLSEFVVWLDGLGERKNLLVALEDVNGYGCHIVKCLASEEIAMRYVPGILTERKRKQSIHREKSDSVDAERVAKVILTNYEETLPAKESIANQEERTISTNLDFLITERRSLVAGQTIMKNQLHAMLHQLQGDHYTDQFSKAFTPKAIKYFEQSLKESQKKETDSEKLALMASIQRRLKRLDLTAAQIKEIDDSMKKTSLSSPAV